MLLASIPRANNATGKGRLAQEQLLSSTYLLVVEIKWKELNTYLCLFFLNQELGKQTSRDTCINLTSPLKLWHLTFFVLFLIYFIYLVLKSPFWQSQEFLNVQEFKHLLQNLKIHWLELMWKYQSHLLFQDFQAILEIIPFLNINTFRYYFKSNIKFLIICLARIFDLFFIKKNPFMSSQSERKQEKCSCLYIK